MKKIYSSLSLFLVFVISLYGRSAVHQYKRINLKAEMLGGESEISEMMQRHSRRGKLLSKSLLLTNKMPVYEITPRGSVADRSESLNKESADSAWSSVQGGNDNGS